MLNGADVLVLEDETLLARRVATYLKKLGAEVALAHTVSDAKTWLSDQSFDFALIDINLPDGSSLELLRKGAFPETTGVVVMTSEGGVSTAVEAMRLGAGDYLAKPFDFDALEVAFGRSRSAKQSGRQTRHRVESGATGSSGFYFGQGLEAIRSQLDKIVGAERRLSGSRPPPVLIEGETGVGKSTLARMLHQQGPRAGSEMIEVNCSTLPESLAESELFGHERGAFTDAKSARIGLFEAADGGTLFLDEISSLSLTIQAKLLTVLESGKFRRVGGTKEISADVRLIAASNTDLKADVAAGRFRADLFHRLDLLRVAIPPLRKRRDDLPELAMFLLTAIARRYRMNPPKLSQRALSCLFHYDWPGNVREMSHELERSLVLHDPVDKEMDLPGVPNLSTGDLERETGAGDQATDWMTPGWIFPEEGFQLEQAIERLIDRALNQTKGNVSAAARLLGVSRDYIRYRKGTAGK